MFPVLSNFPRLTSWEVNLWLLLPGCKKLLDCTLFSHKDYCSSSIWWKCDANKFWSTAEPFRLTIKQSVDSADSFFLEKVKKELSRCRNVMPVWVTDLFIFFWSLYCSSPTPYNGQKYLPDPLNHQGQDDPEDNWLKRPLKSSPFTFMTNKILCNANFAIKLSAGFWKMGITVSTIVTTNIFIAILFR